MSAWNVKNSVSILQRISCACSYICVYLYVLLLPMFEHATYIINALFAALLAYVEDEWVDIRSDLWTLRVLLSAVNMK